MGNSHVTIVNDPSSGVKSDALNCSVTYDRHYDDRNSFIIQATECIGASIKNYIFCWVFLQMIGKYFVMFWARVTREK